MKTKILITVLTVFLAIESGFAQIQESTEHHARVARGYSYRQTTDDQISRFYSRVNYTRH